MNTSDQIIRYFLGRLTPAEAEQFEERLFADEQFAESVFTAEDELLEAYARGELPDDERAWFERNYLTTRARREESALTQGLTHLASPGRKKMAGVRTADGLSTLRSRLRSPVRFRPAYAACLLLFIITGFLWWRFADRGATPRDERVSDEMAVRDQSPSPRPSAAPTELSTEAPSNRQQNLNGGSEPTPAQSLSEPERPVIVPRRRDTPAVAVFSIRPGLLRGEGDGEQLLSIRHGVEIVKLRAALDGNVRRVQRAELQTADGDQILLKTRRQLAGGRGRNSITIDVPARFLTARVYLLRLFDGTGEPVETYTFRVSKPGA